MKKDDKRKLPYFKYSPNCYGNGVFKKSTLNEKKVCQSCGKETKFYYGSMYTEENVHCLCPQCITDGSAAKKFHGNFIQDVEGFEMKDGLINSNGKAERFISTTPGYSSWQGEYWLCCCDDYCAYIGNVTIKELKEKGIFEEVLFDYSKKMQLSLDNAKRNLESMYLYLFQCLHCGKYRVWADMD